MWTNYKRHTARTIAIVVVLYLVFVLDLGTATFAQHLYRIGATPEVMQLGDELSETFVAIARILTDRLRHILR